jgi:hypothetical protein
MSRDKHGKLAKFFEDRAARRSTKGPDTSKGAGRERNVGHKKAEEHSKVSKRK